MSWKRDGQQQKPTTAGFFADVQERGNRHRPSQWYSQPPEAQPHRQQQQPLTTHQRNQQQQQQQNQQQQQQQVQLKWVEQTKPRHYHPLAQHQPQSYQQNHLPCTQSRPNNQTKPQQRQPVQHHHSEVRVTATAAVKQQSTSPAKGKVQPQTQGPYIPPHRLENLGEQPAAPCADLKQFTVQLVPDMFSIQLVASSPAAFQGLAPPRHHSFTSINAYLQEVCQDSGGSFADVWLDTLHITFASLALPAGREQEFVALLHAAAATLPDLTTGCYKIVDLQHTDKEYRQKADVKGTNFYLLDLDSTSEDFICTQFLWLDALHKTAQQVKGSCTDIRSIERQHMSVRAFSLEDAAKSFRRIRREVQARPATMKCAGIRIQQTVDQIVQAGSNPGIIAHGYFYKLQARYPVCLYSSCMQASYHVRRQDELMRHKHKANVAAEHAVVKHMLNQLALSGATDRGSIVQHQDDTTVAARF